MQVTRLLTLVAGLTLSVASQAADQYTTGPLVAYSFDGTTQNFVPGNGWVEQQGTSPQGGTVTFKGQADFGVAKFWMSAMGASSSAEGWSGWSDQIVVTAPAGV
ncbi:MAG TPA: hypothetical protein VGE47_17940, partial [Burkholderiaceae bacterium]